MARTTNSARTVPPRVTTDGGSPASPGPNVEHLGVLVDPDAAALDRVGQAPGQERRLYHRAVRRERGADRAGGADHLGGLLGPEPAQVVLAESERPRLVDLGHRPGPLRLAAHQVDRSALDEVAVDALAGRRWPRRRRPSPAWHGASPASRRARAGGPGRRPRWRTGPSTSRRCGPRRRSPPPRVRAPPRAGTGSASARACAVHRPVNPAPTMQTSTSRSSVSAGRGGSGTGDALPPQGEPLVARCRPRVQFLSEPHAARAPGALAAAPRFPRPALSPLRSAPRAAWRR